MRLPFPPCVHCGRASLCHQLRWFAPRSLFVCFYLMIDVISYSQLPFIASLTSSSRQLFGASRTFDSCARGGGALRAFFPRSGFRPLAAEGCPNELHLERCPERGKDGRWTPRVGRQCFLYELWSLFAHLGKPTRPTAGDSRGLQETLEIRPNQDATILTLTV